MTDSTSGRIPRSKQLVDQVGPKQRSEASSQRSRDRRDAGQVSQAVSGLLAEQRHVWCWKPIMWVWKSW